jgi:hypothetical protein
VVGGGGGARKPLGTGQHLDERVVVTRVRRAGMSKDATQLVLTVPVGHARSVNGLSPHLPIANIYAWSVIATDGVPILPTLLGL